MTSRVVVGLDIGTFAVRAAELHFGSHGVSIRRFAQIGLPYGAVVDGEVTDTGQVGAALQQLWAKGGFSTREVVLGVSNQKAIVRQADVALMPDEELGAALQYMAQDLIPIPIDEALLDFQVIERVEPSEDFGPAGHTRILLGAVTKASIDASLAALAVAKLRPIAVDMVALALLRIVPPLPPREDGKATVDVVVSVGADLTVVSIREGSSTRFVRILARGGADLTRSVADVLEVEMVQAEAIKRHVAGGHSVGILRSTESLLDQGLGPVIDDIGSSIDFYRAQGRVGVDRVAVTGGTTVMPMLVSALSEALGISVERVDPLDWISTDGMGLSETQLQNARPYMAGAIGLALWGAPGVDRQISLLPPELALERNKRRQLAGAAVGLLLLVVVLTAVWLPKHNRVNSAETRAAADQASLTALQTQITSLSGATAVQSQVSSLRSEIATSLAGDVDWVRLLGQLSRVMPTNVTLQSFSGSAPVEGTGTVTPGSVSVAATATGGNKSVVLWLQSLTRLPSVDDAWVGSLSSSGKGKRVSFTSSANLTTKADSSRIRDITGGSGDS
jgi:type IV pilus assembly protein PilM